MTLVDFLQARLDEDERAARSATPGPWEVDDPTWAETIYGPDHVAVVSGGRWGGEASVFEGTGDALHIARHDPTRVLAEVEAKRGLVQLHEPADGHCSSCLESENDLYGKTYEHAPCVQRCGCSPCRTRIIRATTRNGAHETSAS